MLKHLSFLTIFLILLSAGFSASVNIVADAKPTSTIYTYKFDFGEDRQKSFSFEKPSDAQVIITSDEFGKFVSYSVAGDFFIIKPEDTQGSVYTITFESKKISQNLASKGSFSNYATFNFDVEKVTFNLKLDPIFGEPQKIFPRDSSVLEDGSIFWEINSTQEDLLFLVETNLSENLNSESNFTSQTFFLLILLIPILFFIILFMYIKFSSKKEEEKKTVVKKEDPKKEEREVKEKKTEESPKKEEGKKEFDFEGYIKKYLTENEGDVVRVVKKHEGLLQNDILNHEPTLTKSNLSKIISKLHNKHVLNRIKVGKVNKIYLGDALKPEKQEEKKEEKEN